MDLTSKDPSASALSPGVIAILKRSKTTKLPLNIYIIHLRQPQPQGQSSLCASCMPIQEGGRMTPRTRSAPAIGVRMKPTPYIYISYFGLSAMALPNNASMKGITRRMSSAGGVICAPRVANPRWSRSRKCRWNRHRQLQPVRPDAELPV